MSGDARPGSGPRIKCPACGHETVYDATNPYRPFCSGRCRMIDLGAWASESYRIPETTPRDGTTDAPVAGDDD